MSEDETTWEEWVTSREGAELLGVSQPNFLYYARIGEVASKPGQGQKMYSRADTLKVRKKLVIRVKKPVQEKVLIDWLLAADVPAGLKLSMHLYPGEVDLAEAAIYQSWRKNNIHLTMAAFCEDRSECYASVQVVPLRDEQVILDVLRGTREESSINPDEIAAYDREGAYNLLVTSATCLPDRPQLLYQVLYKYIAFWLEMFPQRFIKKLYAQAVSDDGMRIVQHFFMSPRLDLAPNAFMLDMAYPAVSRMVKQFKQRLEEIAPLPDELQWPPIELSHTQPQHAPIASTPITTATTPQHDASTVSDMPDGLVGIAEYARHIGVAETTLKKAAAAGHIPVITGSWKKGKATVKIALDAEGRAEADKRYPKRDV